MSSLGTRVELQQWEKLLVQRARELRTRLEAGDDSVTPEAYEIVKTLAAIAPAVAPEASGRLLTTAELAENMGIAPKTLLKHAAAGKIKPAVRQGKLLRWNGSERL